MGFSAFTGFIVSATFAAAQEAHRTASFSAFTGFIVSATLPRVATGRGAMPRFSAFTGFIVSATRTMTVTVPSGVCVGFSAFTGFIVSATAPFGDQTAQKQPSGGHFGHFHPLFDLFSALFEPPCQIRASIHLPKPGGCSIFAPFSPPKAPSDLLFRSQQPIRPPSRHSKQLLSPRSGLCGASRPS